MTQGVPVTLTAAQYMASQKAPKAEGRPMLDAVCMEPAAGWWSSNSHFGRRFALTLPAQEGVIVDLLDSGEIPGPPRLVSCTLFREQFVNTASQSPINADLRARITYGSGGTSNTVEMDWGNGGSFAIQAHTIRIEAITYRVETIDIAGAEQPYNANKLDGLPAKWAIGATIGIDGASPPLPPTFTTTRLCLSPIDAQQSFRVPNFARKVTPMMAIPAILGFNPADYTIATVGDVFALQAYTLTEEILRDGLLLHPNARAVNMLKNGAVPDSGLCMQYLLGL
jgi:hypothetical protein